MEEMYECLFITLVFISEAVKDTEETLVFFVLSFLFFQKSILSILAEYAIK